MIRTACRCCGGPLTHGQQVRRRTYCSRSCAKEQYHSDHPEKAVEFGKRSWAKVGREKFIARLKAALTDCHSRAEAYRRGYKNGYAAKQRAQRSTQRREGIAA